MNTSNIVNRSRATSLAWLSLLAVATILSLSACRKSESAQSEAAPGPTETTGDAAEGTEAATEGTAAEGTTTDPIVISADPIDVGQAMSTTDKALQSKDWKTATETLLQVQFSGSAQTFQQSWDYNKRMTDLQNELAEAANNGDPRAQAAINVLRKSRRVR